MMEEGVIKFNCLWNETTLPESIDCSELLQARNKLYQAGLIGYDENEQVGYGNISSRIVGNTFIVSGTQTGHIATLTKAQLSLVTAAAISTNTVHCSGPAKASSESLTHAAIYQLIANANAVIHVHNNAMWQKLKYTMPASKEDIGYGTTAMANEILRLSKEENLLQHKLLVMAGHQGGLISFGATMDEAMQVLLDFYE